MMIINLNLNNLNIRIVKHLKYRNVRVNNNVLDSRLILIVIH